MSNNRNVITQSYEFLDHQTDFGVNELKLIMLGIIQIDSVNDTEFNFFEISLIDLEKKLDVDLNYQRIKNLMTKLFGISINILPREFDKITGKLIPQTELDLKHLFSHMSFKKGILKMKFDEEMKPYLLKLNTHFVSSLFNSIYKMRSPNSINLHNKLKQKQNQSKWETSVLDLMDFLKVGKSFRRFSNFNQKILSIAINEINEKSDIFVDVQFIKKSRTVEKLVFRIYDNEEKQKLNLIENNDKTQIYLDNFNSDIKMQSVIGLTLIDNSNYYKIIKQKRISEKKCELVLIAENGDKFRKTYSHLQINQLANLSFNL